MGSIPAPNNFRAVGYLVDQCTVMEWLDVVENFQRLKEAFDSTSR